MGGRGGSSRKKSGGGGEPTISDLIDKYGSKGTPYGEITRKQAGVLFRLTKTGELKAGEDSMNFLYNRYTNDSRQPTTSTWDKDIASSLSMSVSAAMNRDYTGARVAFNHAVDTHFQHYSDSSFPNKSKVKLKKK